MGILFKIGITILLGTYFIPTCLAEDYTSSANVSYYGPGFHGKKTASGERFNMHGLSLAHKTLPFGTKVKMKCSATNKTIVARVNDRGPFIKGRSFDLSLGAAKALGIHSKGVAKVDYKIID